MLAFDRPVTWVRLPDRRDGPVKVVRSAAPPDDQRACHERFVQAHFVHGDTPDDAALSAALNLIRDGLQIENVLAPAPWCLARVILLAEAAPQLRARFCAEQLAAIVRTAISLVALMRVCPGEATDSETRAALGLVGQGDWDMVVALARLYDRDVHTRLPTAKRSRPLLGILGQKRG
jgi:hypothetical protein